jgi:four helix bundle protein
LAVAKRFEDLEVWQLARDLTRIVYKVSSGGRLAKDFGLRDQLRKASVSVMSNLAEGFERGGSREFLQFVALAKGSCGEVRSQLYVALDQEYLGRADFDRVFELTVRLSRMLASLLRYLRNSPISGSKYKSAVIEP